MRVVISAGGTGGHIYPALAIINKIKEKEPNSEFLYIGTHNRMEKDIVPKYNIPFEQIEIYGFSKTKILRNFKSISCIIKGIKKCKRLIKNFNPDVVIGVGGYVTVPVIYSAKKLGYKTIIHEQNSIPGKSNKFLVKYTDKILVSFPSSIKYFPEDKTIFTGNPCSEEAIKKEAIDKTELGLSKNKKLVLIVMGSLGSIKANNALYKAMKSFSNKDYEVLYVTGDKFYEEYSKRKYPDNVKVVPFINEMTRVMKVTDVMVSRAGASTMSEIISLGVPTILVPSPYVANNHQYKNAMDLVKENAALLLEEKDLNGENLTNKIDELIKNPNIIKENLKKFIINDSASKIYEAIKGRVDYDK